MPAGAPSPENPSLAAELFPFWLRHIINYGSDAAGASEKVAPIGAEKNRSAGTMSDSNVEDTPPSV